MPSKKQRRRREKTFRHEYDLVVLDEQGNETSIDPEERRAAREAKEKSRARTGGAESKTKAAATRGGRAIKVPPQPSWNRALKRGGVMGALMLVAFVFLFKNAPIGLRLAWGIFYAAAFVPLTYWIDRTAYRTYERRLAKSSKH